MKKYLIFGNAESAHILKWVTALVPYFDVYVISSTRTQAKIHELLPESHIFDLGTSSSVDKVNYNVLFKLFKIRKIIRKTEPDILNAHYITSHGFLLALIRWTGMSGYFFIQSSWGSDILVTPFRNSIFKWITRFALRSADLNTCVSERMHQIITSMTDIRCLNFSYGTMVMPEYDPKEKDDFLFFSNRHLSKNYNIDKVLLYFSKVASVEERARLVVANDGNGRESLYKLAKELGIEDKVEFTGILSADKQIIYYKKSRFYISIPTSDAIAVSLMEAMSYGCIPVVSDLPSNHEMVNDGENGIFLVEGNEAPQKVFKMLEKKEKIAETNRAIIQNRFYFPGSIKKFVDEINKSLTSGR
jgi:glycosyltransferase involved in cell wall biosynthesis